MTSIQRYEYKYQSKRDLDNWNTRQFQRMSLSSSSSSSSSSSAQDDKAEKKTVMSTLDIHFSQRSVSNTFRDGSSLEKVIQQLATKQLAVNSIEPIRVVNYHAKWITLDNRRLRVFIDALIGEIPVSICSLSNPEIAKEFHAKRTNKTSDGGGMVRMSSISSSPQDFDNGIYVFTKHVLNWTVQQISQPLFSLQELPSQFSTIPQYYRSFLNLILEETRAVLLAGIESQEKTTQLTLLSTKRSKRSDNPSILTFAKPQGQTVNPKANDALLLTYTGHSSRPIELIALVNYAPSDEGASIITVKSVIEEDSYSFEAFEKPNVRWNVKPLGSIITQLRMYDACVSDPRIAWLGDLLRPYPPEKSARNSSQANENESKQCESTIDHTDKDPSAYRALNGPQQLAVEKFLKLETGIQLVQGPPGTGKTTMILELLKRLISQGRTLVCAPSNQALQVIASRFALENPAVPIILAGAEDKLPAKSPELVNIFIHTWGAIKAEEVEEINNRLSILLLKGGNTKEIRRLFAKLIADFYKYRLNFLKNDDLKEFETCLQKYDEMIASTGKIEEIADQLRVILSRTKCVLSNLARSLQEMAMDDSDSGLEMHLLNHSLVIFATLSVSGRKSFKEMDQVNALVVDEAGQAVEAETLIPFSTTPTKCLLIGDTNQLPATVISAEAVKRKFDRSMMQRLFEDCKHPYTMLTVQYRMDPEIRSWPSAQYYGDKLMDAKEVSARFQVCQDMPSFLGPYSLINVEGRETNVHHSYQNKEEAEIVSNLVQHLKTEFKIDVVSQVGVITFYKGQATLINERLQPMFSGIKVHTVDSFQGGECDFIIISFVRSNPKGTVGFLNDFRRLNVALTRAKHSLIMVGNAKTLTQCKKETYELIANAQQRNFFFESEEILKKIKPSKRDISPSLTSRHSANQEEKTGSSGWISQPTKKSESSKTSSIPSNYKTALCNFYSKNAKSCHKGDKCQFAHGEADLRAVKNQGEKEALTSGVEAQLQSAEPVTTSKVKTQVAEALAHTSV